MLPFLALLLVTLAWFLLPMLPALRELLRPTDVQPLLVVDRSAGEVDFFARNFRQYLDRQMAAITAASGAPGQEGVFPDGTAYRLVRTAAEAAGGSDARLTVVERPLTLPGGENFLVELHARAPLTGGAGAVYRAVCAEANLTLGERSRVLRWAHAAGTLSAGPHCVLQGRISSDQAVSLGGGVSFERIGAPVIAVGTAGEPPLPPPAQPKEFRLPEDAMRLGESWRIEGDLEIPGGVRVPHSLVVAGNLKIGLGTIIEGSVKSHRDVELADEAQVQGSVVARRRVLTGSAAWMGGPVIAEERVRLGRGTVVGGPGRPATVNAPEVELATGATVYGQVNAPQGGRTL